MYFPYPSFESIIKEFETGRIDLHTLTSTKPECFGILGIANIIEEWHGTEQVLKGFKQVKKVLESEDLEGYINLTREPYTFGQELPKHIVQYFPSEMQKEEFNNYVKAYNVLYKTNKHKTEI